MSKCPLCLSKIKELTGQCKKDDHIYSYFFNAKKEIIWEKMVIGSYTLVYDYRGDHQMANLYCISGRKSKSWSGPKGSLFYPSSIQDIQNFLLLE